MLRADRNGLGLHGGENLVIFIEKDSEPGPSSIERKAPNSSWFAQQRARNRIGQNWHIARGKGTLAMDSDRSWCGPNRRGCGCEMFQRSSFWDYLTVTEPARQRDRVTRRDHSWIGSIQIPRRQTGR